MKKIILTTLSLIFSASALAQLDAPKIQNLSPQGSVSPSIKFPDLVPSQSNQGQTDFQNMTPDQRYRARVNAAFEQYNQRMAEVRKMQAELMEQQKQLQQQQLQQRK